MWIEQQLADALPKIGRSKEANLIVAEGMKFKVDLAKKRIDLLDDLAEKDKERLGYVQGDVDARASKLLKPYVEQRKKELINDIHKVKQSNKVAKGYKRMLDPETGEVWDILEHNIAEAKKSGWESL